MSDTHQERIRAAFTPQAATFEDARLNVAFTSSVPWLLDHMAAGRDDIVLDVAGGTGIVSRAMANRVARVVVADSTPAMIDEGRRHATDERLTNLEFVRGAVANLPFADAAFTLVFARFLLHHLIDPRPCPGRDGARVRSRGASGGDGFGGLGRPGHRRTPRPN
jgi:ubiquinone/menaquinone biosynthesis C-methylase UbiE